VKKKFLSPWIKKFYLHTEKLILPSDIINLLQLSPLAEEHFHSVITVYPLCPVKAQPLPP
jgi:hypothetical protein